MTAEDSKPDVNEHIRQGIKYYASLQIEDGPGYALMVSGDWGTGKTHTVRQVLKDLSIDPVWVSLYGLRDSSQIDYEIYRQMHPLLSHPKTRLAGKLAKGFIRATFKIDLDDDGKADGSVSTALPDIKLSEFNNPENASLLVFDDLERAQFEKMQHVLGYINSFVEILGVRAIVIGSDKKIDEENKEYKDVKEKLIGRIYKIKPDIESAVSSILKNFREGSSIFIGEQTEFITDFCRKFDSESDYGEINFRCLFQALLDYQQIHQKFASAITDQEENLAKFFQTYLVLGYFSKKGFLVKKDLLDLSESELVYRIREQEKPRIYELLNYCGLEGFSQEKYVSISDWSQALFEGNPSGLLENLKHAAAFQPKDKEATWVRVWHGLTLEQDEFENEVSKLEEEIRERKYEAREEILHLIGISIWLKNEVYPDSVESTKERHQRWSEIFDDWKNYIDEKRTKIPLSLREHYYREDNLGYFGLAVMRRETSEFQDLSDYLYSVASKEFNENILKKITNLANNIPNDYHSFYCAMCVTNNPGDSYHDIPVLHQLKADEFADILLSTPSTSFRKALMFFKSRYDGNFLSTLEPEYDWFLAVTKRLEDEQSKTTGIQQLRLKNAIELYVKPALGKWEEYKKRKK